MPAERREQLMAEYRTSGLTMAAFAKREGSKYPTFAGWMAKAQSSVAAKPPIRFAEIRLPDGTVLRGSHVGKVAAWVRALRD